MSKWTEQLQKELTEKFGKEVSFGPLRPVGPLPESELSVLVPALKLLEVSAFLKTHKDSPFLYLSCLTAIDYPKSLLGNPPNVEPFLSHSTLEKRGEKPIENKGRSSPLDPPRLLPEEIPNSLLSLEHIKKTWPDALGPRYEQAKVVPQPANAPTTPSTSAPATAPSTGKPVTPAPATASATSASASPAQVASTSPVPSTQAKSEEKKPDEKKVSAPSTEAKMTVKPEATASPPAAAPTVAASTSSVATPPSAKPATSTATAPTTTPKPPVVLPKPPFSVTKYDQNKIAMVYVLFSHATKTRVVLRVELDREKPEVDSVTPIWRGADWSEREVFDLYGVTFKNHPDLRRIFMDYPEFPGGHPLRKDYERPGFMVRLPKV